MKRIEVRKEFTEEAVWREALGNLEPLLTHADKTDCLDAPDWIPAGSSEYIFYHASVSLNSRQSVIHRDSI